MSVKANSVTGCFDLCISEDWSVTKEKEGIVTYAKIPYEI